MFYPQSNFHSQGSVGYSGYPQGVGYSQGFGYPQGFGYSQGFGQPNFAQGLPQIPHWQHPAQQQTQQHAALQQQAMLHLLATQLAQPFAQQHLPQQHLQGTGEFAGSANGAAQSPSLWQQPQAGPEQINPAPLQQSQQQLLQRLAQYHYLVAQQLAQLAAQTIQGPGTPYAGQFMPTQFGPGSGQFISSQLGANFVPGITMH
jgi:hypothetical protein